MCLTLIISLDVVAQNSYSARFRLTSLDTAASMACYDIQLSNPGVDEWRLFAYNFNIFFDARVAAFVKDSVVSDLHVSESDPISRIIPVGTVINSGLSYDSIGFLRVSISEIISGEGQLFEPSSDWISISQICFFIDIDDITNPNTCLGINFGTQQIRDATGARPDIVQETDAVTVSSDLIAVDRLDVIPDRSFNSCFVLDEDTEGLCGDGIDNDEDGLMDCDDPSCSPGSIQSQREEIECFRPVGSINLEGGTGAGLMYSIDGGLTFSTDSIFSGLDANVYDIIITRNDVTSCAYTNTIILQAPDCSETDDLACTDGIDNDGDGLIDCADDSCQPRIETVGVIQPSSCPRLNDGVIEITSLFIDLEYSIDSGMTYQSSNLFDSIEVGTYNVMIRNMITMCEVPSRNNPIEVTAVNPCAVDATLPSFYIPNVIAPNNPPNDQLTLESEEDLQLRTFAVYDRWGNEVFFRRDISSAEGIAWDGRYQNGSVRSGVYVYLIEFDLDGEILSTSGDVLVLN